MSWAGTGRMTTGPAESGAWMMKKENNIQPGGFLPIWEQAFFIISLHAVVRISGKLACSP